MKKNFVLFISMLAALSLPVLFTSCSDDDDDGSSSTSPKKLIVGTWKADKQYSAEVRQFELVFNSDGTGYEHCWYFDEWSVTHEVGTEYFTYEIEDNSSVSYDWSSSSYVYNEDYTLYFTWNNDVVTKYKNESWLFPYGFGLMLYFDGSDKMYIAYEGFTRQ